MPILMSPPSSEDEDCFESAGEGSDQDPSGSTGPMIELHLNNPVIAETVGIGMATDFSTSSTGPLDIEMFSSSSESDGSSSDTTSQTRRKNRRKKKGPLKKVDVNITPSSLDVLDVATSVNLPTRDNASDGLGEMHIHDQTDSAQVTTGGNLVAGEGVLDWESRWAKEQSSTGCNSTETNPDSVTTSPIGTCIIPTSPDDGWGDDDLEIYGDTLDPEADDLDEMDGQTDGGGSVRKKPEPTKGSCIIPTSPDDGWEDDDLEIDGDTWDPEADDLDEMDGQTDGGVMVSKTPEPTKPKPTPLTSASALPETSLDSRAQTSSTELHSQPSRVNGQKTEPPPPGVVNHSTAKDALARLTGEPVGVENRPAWSGWGGSLLSAASTFSSSVSDGFATVVEGALGAPTPEDLAAGSKVADDKITSTETPAIDAAASNVEKTHQSEKTQESVLNSFSSAIGNTGKSLVSGSIDVLETLGKKTFEVITDKDSETSRRTLKFQRKQNTLSQLLKEVKDRGDPSLSQALMNEPTVSYASFFEEYNGDVHLEALTLLSQNCAKIVVEKVSRLSESQQEQCEQFVQKFQSTVVPQEQFDNSFSEDTAENELFKESLNDVMVELAWGFVPCKLCKVASSHSTWIKDCCKRQDEGERLEGEDIFKQGLRCLSEMTSSCLELLHKSGQLALADAKDPSESCQVLSRLQQLLCNEIAAMASKFSTAMNTAADDSEDPDHVISLLTNLFLEANNSGNYIQEAFQQLAPVLRLLLVQKITASEDDKERKPGALPQIIPKKLHDQ